MPLFIGKVGDGDDGSSRLALRCLQHRSDVEWNAFAPGRERWRGEQAVEFHGKPNLRALCDAPELWGLEKERAKAYKNRALVLSNEPEALKGFEKRSAAWLEERKACGTDVTCIGERIEARIQEIARQGRAGVRESH